MPLLLTKYGLYELQEKLSKADRCPTHGSDDNMMICTICGETRCYSCDRSVHVCDKKKLLADGKIRVTASV